MPAMFKNYDEQYFTYESAKEVKEKGDKYVVYDAYGSVLGAHLIDSIEQFTTDPLMIKPSTEG
ncbi:hypothetical protein [Pseudomonas azotoformans]|uniref:hypothetical protein n=1 Tax=Pseudomonas azotoformans TaxID=47878 RepID=UPI00098FD531|nr:hypothetical protein [Pseudomonas azotoformans]AQT94243.1 hypothetical protein B1R45_13520 [Pseudomonas azotoformans]UMY52020.1 hypothetical protein MLC69_13465 [Pseudomonas azotoformans]